MRLVQLHDILVRVLYLLLVIEECIAPVRSRWLQYALRYLCLLLCACVRAGGSVSGMVVACTRWSGRLAHHLNRRTMFACIIGRLELDLSNRSKLRLTMLFTSLNVGWCVVMR